MITDWLMVIITFVYVIATICIYRANIISAKAARDQLVEEKRQYEEEQRPYISYQFIFVRHALYGVRFTNHGRRVANHVQIQLEQEFLDSVSKSQFYDGLQKMQTTEFSLGIGQCYDIFFGGEEFRQNPNMKPIAGQIIYQGAKKSYNESFYIDFEKYAPVFPVNSFADDFHQDMKELIYKLGEIEKELKTRQSTGAGKDTENQ